MEMVPAEIAAIVAGGDALNALLRAEGTSRVQRAAHGLLNRLEGEASITSSSTAPVSGSSCEFGSPRRTGLKASLVEATSVLYFEPTLEPERTMPPGKGRITPGTTEAASTAASAAASTSA